MSKSSDSTKKVIIIGGGPSGLTAAYDCAKKKIPVTCYEADTMVGGISRTVEYKKFRFDIGGHRFFSKIERVNKLWDEILGENFLVRPRLSRIFYNGIFFCYPLKAQNALAGLGLWQSLLIIASYIKSKIKPEIPEESFDQWVSNRFGRRLYQTFFKTYTEKVWGIDCTNIRAEWAAQRIKGLSLWSAVINALFKQKNVAKTLINEFHYPRLGPGQMYETMARKAQDLEADIKLNHRVTEVHHKGEYITGVTISNDNDQQFIRASDIISTMPISELITSMKPKAPAKVQDAAKGLRYRALLTINLLINKPQQLPDTWIYIHDPKVRMGRIQCFANWSPAMVPNSEQSSMGLEYFCWEKDELWNMADKDIIELGIKEISQLNLLSPDTVFDAFVIRMPKCYPVYDEKYEQRIAVIKNYLTKFSNLQLCGRYGLFKYNNMDHSMLTAMLAVENITGANHDVWSVNTDDDYHEA